MRKKGAFSRLRLAIARDYIFPVSHRNMILIGGVGALVFFGVFALDIFFGKSHLISNGPLSSNHANFEQNCSACHLRFSSVKNEKCSVCHEKYGDKLGVYTFASHNIYRSNDVRRIAPSKKEGPCFSCHSEHQGREALITNVPDSRCLTCHNFGSFNDKHPQFEFVVKKILDDSSLQFTHIQHLKEVQKKEKLVDIEKACLYCHNPQPDGENFESLNFDRHCDACHVATSKATPWLKIKDSREFDSPGVETLEMIMIRKRQEHSTIWAFYTNPNDFRMVGNRVRKSPVYHKDPWIMENLKMLRRAIYPGLELSDLLKTAQNVPADNAKLYYQESIQLLKEYSAELQANQKPKSQEELARIERLINAIEKKIREQSSSFDFTNFQLSHTEETPNFSKEQIELFKSFTNELIAPCRMCHKVINASIAPVQKEQRALRRAEFNHRAHILQRGCLDCHNQIPFREYIGTSIKVDEKRDCAMIQNIPKIEICQKCHTSGVASTRCITCHYFHPNKTNRTNLLLYMD